MVHKVKNIDYLALYQKRLPILVYTIYWIFVLENISSYTME